MANFTIRQVLFLVDYRKVWSFGRVQVICLYLKIAEKFMRLILLDGYKYLDVARELTNYGI